MINFLLLKMLVRLILEKKMVTVVVLYCSLGSQESIEKKRCDVCNNVHTFW